MSVYGLEQIVDHVKPPPFLTMRQEGVVIAVKVQPRASRNEIGEALGNELKIKVTAPPTDSAANEALILLLADKLGCSRGSIQLMRGHTSRHKQLLITGIAVNELVKKLAQA